jgi:hypothetical protein
MKRFRYHFELSTLGNPSAILVKAIDDYSPLGDVHDYMDETQLLKKKDVPTDFALYHIQFVINLILNRMVEDGVIEGIEHDDEV